MNTDLWEKVLGYASNKKYFESKGLILDKLLRKKVAEKFIINKFLEAWIVRNQDDPLDILEDMLLKYSLWEMNAREYNNKDLIELYDVYVKTLLGVKNYIKKELSI